MRLSPRSKRILALASLSNAELDAMLAERSDQRSFDVTSQHFIGRVHADVPASLFVRVMGGVR